MVVRNDIGNSAASIAIIAINAGGPPKVRAGRLSFLGYALVGAWGSHVVMVLAVQHVRSFNTCGRQTLSLQVQVLPWDLWPRLVGAHPRSTLAQGKMTSKASLWRPGSRLGIYDGTRLAGSIRKQFPFSRAISLRMIYPLLLRYKTLQQLWHKCARGSPWEMVARAVTERHCCVGAFRKLCSKSGGSSCWRRGRSASFEMSARGNCFSASVHAMASWQCALVRLAVSGWKAEAQKTWFLLPQRPCASSAQLVFFHLAWDRDCKSRAALTKTCYRTCARLCTFSPLTAILPSFLRPTSWRATAWAQMKGTTTILSCPMLSWLGAMQPTLRQDWWRDRGRVYRQYRTWTLFTWFKTCQPIFLVPKPSVTDSYYFFIICSPPFYYNPIQYHNNNII